MIGLIILQIFAIGLCLIALPTYKTMSGKIGSILLIVLNGYYLLGNLGII